MKLDRVVDDGAISAMAQRLLDYARLNAIAMIVAPINGPSYGDRSNQFLLSCLKLLSSKSSS